MNTRLNQVSRQRKEYCEKKFEQWWDNFIKNADIDRLSHLKETYKQAWEAGYTAAKKAEFKGF